MRADVIRQFVRTQYGDCPTCPIVVRPEIRQPMIGIGIPTGPPEVVGAENLSQGLGVIQNLSIQLTSMAATSATLQADDAQAAMGLNTAVRTPNTDKGA